MSKAYEFISENMKRYARNRRSDSLEALKNSKAFVLKPKNDIFKRK